MDAKSKANFINSVVAGQTVPCPKCEASNKPDAKFCVTCGAEMSAPSSAPAFAPIADDAAPSNAPAFAPIADDAAPAAPAAPKAPAPKAVVYEEPVSAFADGLPSWDLNPPQVVVRRR